MVKKWLNVYNRIRNIIWVISISSNEEKHIPKGLKMAFREKGAVLTMQHCSYECIATTSGVNKLWSRNSFSCSYQQSTEYTPKPSCRKSHKLIIWLNSNWKEESNIRNCRGKSPCILWMYQQSRQKFSNLGWYTSWKDVIFVQFQL